MNVFKWLNENSGITMFLATLLVAVITACYARFTKHILDQNKKSNQLNSRPILEILKTDKHPLLLDDIKNLMIMIVIILLD